MKAKNQTHKARIAELERKLLETEAQMIHVYHFAAGALLKADCNKSKGGGILVRLHWLGGSEVCLPFMIKDGFSPETIAALRADMTRSFLSATEFKPPMPESV